jgi:acetylglutamate kinase
MQVGADFDRPIVVKLGGAVIDRFEPLSRLCAVLAQLHRSLSEVGTARGVVIVHGGGLAIDGHLRRLGYEAHRVDGIRVTPPSQIDAVVEVLAGRMNRSLVGTVNAALAGDGAAPCAVGLSIGDGGLTTARRLARGETDFGCVGEVTGGDPRVVETLLAGGFLPIISPIACDDAGGGGPLNVNADDAAAAVAGVLGARSLVLLSDVPGVLDADGALIDRLDQGRIDELIEAGTIHSGMIPKVRAALDTAERTGVATRIASWNNPEQLLALADGGSCGTLVVPSASASFSYSTPPAAGHSS